MDGERAWLHVLGGGGLVLAQKNPQDMCRTLSYVYWLSETERGYELLKNTKLRAPRMETVPGSTDCQGLILLHNECIILKELKCFSLITFCRSAIVSTVNTEPWQATDNTLEPVRDTLKVSI